MQSNENLSAYRCLLAGVLLQALEDYQWLRNKGWIVNGEILDSRPDKRMNHHWTGTNELRELQMFIFGPGCELFIDLGDLDFNADLLRQKCEPHYWSELKQKNNKKCQPH